MSSSSERQLPRYRAALMTVGTRSRIATRLSVACFLVTAAGAMVAGILCLLDRDQLHKAVGFHEATFHLHYPLIRSFVAAALLASIIGLVAACASLRGVARTWGAALWVATVALLVFGIQHSPAHYTFSQPRSGLFFASGQRSAFPFPQMHRFGDAAVLTFLAAGSALVAAWVVARRDEGRGSGG